MSSNKVTGTMDGRDDQPDNFSVLLGITQLARNTDREAIAYGELAC